MSSISKRQLPINIVFISFALAEFFYIFMDMKKRFYLYTSWQESISLLSIEEQAQMLHNFFNYAKGEEPVLNTPGLKLVWAGVNYLLQEDDRKYNERIEIARNANKVRHVKKDTLPQNNLRSVKEDTLTYVNVNVNVNDNDNDNVNVDGNDGVMVETPLEKFNRLMNQ
jgi:hypothetical protein